MCRGGPERAAAARYPFMEVPRMPALESDYRQRSCVAAPCAAAADGLGHGCRASTCTRCGLFVYDLEGLTATQATDLTLANEALPSPRFFRRRDGKYLTRNCPVGLNELRARMRQSTG